MGRMRYTAAMYLRLSKEEGELESGSIGNQRLLLWSYIKSHFPGCQVEEFSDDGFTGTNLKRPQLRRLLEKAESGEIDVILVKDFSRFSRDYLTMGEYLEKIFPCLGIRFISINDGYDSLEHAGCTPELDAAFRELLYDLYSRDLSAKVKAALEIRKSQGLYSVANAPFGYRADRESRSLVPHQEEGRVVKRIFDLAMEGKNGVEIAELLNGEGVLPPGKKGRWRHGAVCSILRNRVYVGDFVYGKYETLEPGGKIRKKPESEWKVRKNHHPPIVDRLLFQEVQEKRGRSGAFPSQERE